MLPPLTDLGKSMSGVARVAALLACMTMFLVSTQAVAQEGVYPNVQFTVPVQIQNDWLVHRSDGSPSNSLNADIEPQVDLLFSQDLILTTHITLDQQNDPGPGDFWIFQDQELYIEELFLRYRPGRYDFLVGKFDATFAQGPNLAPGIYGTDFVDDYQVNENWGGQVGYRFGGGESGTHTILASTFFADTTVLSEALITGRPRLRLSDGGPGNTEDFSSFAVNYYATAFANSGIEYSLGFVNLGKGVGNTSDEQGYSGTLTWSIPLVDGNAETLDNNFVELRPFVEVAHFENAGGTKGLQSTYYSGFMEVFYGRWDVSAGGTLRSNGNHSGAMGTDDYLATGTVQYNFDGGLALAVGYRVQKDSGVRSNGPGTQLIYQLQF